MKFNSVLLQKRTSSLLVCILAVAFLTLFSACTKSSENKSETTNQSSSEATEMAGSTGTTGASGATGESGANNESAGDSSAVDLSTDANGLSKATVVLKTAKGTLKFKFYSKDAPNTVKRMVELIQSKFFDGLAFHRVVPGFVVQSGDPKSKNKSDPAVGTGGSGQKLKAEFNGRKHVRGTVAMARAADPDSADSQFYICLGAFPHLDGQYTVIGQVVDYGEKVNDKDVLDRITLWDEITDMHLE